MNTSRTTKYFLSPIYTSSNPDRFNLALNEAVRLRDEFIKNMKTDIDITDEKLDFSSVYMGNGYHVVAVITLVYYSKK